MKFYDISLPSSNLKSKKDNIYLLFGEHPRELISAELGYDFVKFLCKRKNFAAKKILQKNNFRIMVNANPNKRIEVERGDYCIRGNPNNVDINRNWDFYWGEKITMPEENPGTRPFSEIETSFIRDSVIQYSPRLFLTVHSGEYSLFHPYAFADDVTNNQQSNKFVFYFLIKKHC